MPTTKWTLIASLRGDDESESRAAINELCRAYHYPLYCFIRRNGLSHHDAEDALHDFFGKLLRNDAFSLADSEKGRLRSYLLKSLQRFLSGWKQKRSRDRAVEFTAEVEAFIVGSERRYAMEEASFAGSPDRLYDRQWAGEMMNLTLNRLRDRYAARKRDKLFDALVPVLRSGGSLTDHDSERISANAGLQPGALRTALHRMLKDFREALNEEVLQTVEDRTQASAELEVLMTAFARD